MRPDIHGRIAERARLQLGLVTSDDLDAIGVTRQQRRTMVASGRWERRSRRVLADPCAPRTRHQEVLAGVLDVPGGVATDATAAWLVGMAGFHPRRPKVLVRRGGNHRPELAEVHETFWLPDTHRQVVHGVPCVSDARLCFELASIVKPQRLRRLVDWQRSNRGLDYGELARVAAELCRRGKPGSAEMRLVVDERMPGYVPPASELEAVFRDFCDTYGLPQGVRQTNAGGAAWIGRVDVAFLPHKVLVELDSRRWHDTSTAFDDDRARTNALVLAGWRVVRITWRMLHDEPDKVAELLRGLFVR
jgi:hypothetical protein